MTTIETREERISQGKAVDPGWMANNMVAGAGGLNSFGSMVNDVYQLEYNALLNDPDQKQMLMGDFEKKALPDSMSTNSSKVSKLSVSSSKNGVSALELFNMPNKYSGNNSGSTSVSKVTTKIGKMSIQK
jgi:hypothetical protein